MLSFSTPPFKLPIQIAAFIVIQETTKLAFIISLQYQKFMTYKMLQDYSLTISR